MSRPMVFAFLGSLLLSSGCYIEANDNGEGPFDDDAEQSDCTSPHPEKPTSPATPADDAGTSDAAGCKAHADCGAGFFCLFGSGQCTTAAECSAEADCLAGFNCDVATKSCLPAAHETCGELENEAACLGRDDCAPSYAGVDCSCGPDCTCKGGEPGCVCSSFEFFRCELVLQ